MLFNEISNAERAQVIVEALPYIRRFYGKVLVVKYGGNAMIDDTLKQQVMEDIVLLHLVGVKVVLVHGGGPEISEAMADLGKEPVFVDGLRVTDEKTMDIVQMVLAGKINKTLVNLVQMKGGRAIGISGMDGRLVEAKFKDKRLGYVGEITKVNIAPIKDLLDNDYIPVVSSLGCDKKGNTYNVNGDTFAARIAEAIGAERMVMMTDIGGIMKDKNDEDSLISELTVSEAKKLMDDGTVSGGMIPKVECCIDAIEHGIKKVTILDGRRPHAVLMELLTDEGAGTMIFKGE